MKKLIILMSLLLGANSAGAKEYLCYGPLGGEAAIFIDYENGKGEISLEQNGTQFFNLPLGAGPTRFVDTPEGFVFHSRYHGESDAFVHGEVRGDGASFFIQSTGMFQYQRDLTGYKCAEECNQGIPFSAKFCPMK